MANLEFCDTHNMVTYLQKPDRSEGLHQIVDFLNKSHIRYALTERPTIYVSLIQQFWQTTTASTLDSGKMEITATIDRKVKGPIVQGKGSTVLVESHHIPIGAPSTSQPHLSPTFKIPIRQEIKAPQPSSPPHTNVADEATSTGVNVRYGGATTTVTSLDAGHGSGNINKTSSMLDDSPLPRVHTHRSDEGRMKHNELMDLVTKLLDRVVALETDLKHTQKFYGAAYTKLIMKVKKLEKTVKISQARRKAKIVVSDDKEDLEDPSKQERKIDEIDQDPNILLIQHVSTAEKEVSTAEQVSTTGASITTASVDVSPISSTRRVSIADDITMAETLVYIRRSASKEKG
nr:hypothetical protein [Tanacetum cinerariifolium]